MAYRNVIFDYDGVLVQSLEPWYIAMEKVNAEFDITLTEPQKLYVMAEFLRAGELGIPKDKLQSYIQRLRSVAIPDVNAAPVYEGTNELLSYLSGKKKLAVLSGNLNLRIYLDKKGMTKYFEPYIISGQDVKKKKPDPEGMEKLLSMMNAERSETVFVGDTITDIQAANASHMDSVLFYPPSHSKFYKLEDLMAEKPTYTVASHQELKRLLL